MTLNKTIPIVSSFLLVFQLYSVYGQFSQTVAQWQVSELAFTSGVAIEDPIHQIDLLTTFTHESGQKWVVRGFWNGGDQWKVRFQPKLTGSYKYVTQVEGDVKPEGLQGQSGTIVAMPYTGDNPLYTHGSLRVSENGRYFQYQDGTPFLWIGDTNWSGPHKASMDDWEQYLSIRKDQGFNLLQVMMTNSLAFAANAEGRQAYIGTDKIYIDPSFFQYLDKRIEAINQHGMAFGGVLIWSASWNQQARHLNPGQTLSEEQIILLGRYLMARYGAYHSVWFLGGDDDYSDQKNLSDGNA